MTRQITDTSKRPFDVSIVVPFLNEKENLPQLCEEVSQVMSQTKYTYEVLLIDDGSSDGSAELVESLGASDHRIKLVQLTRNFGQTAAMAAGFEHASGRIYIAMDGDNQNDPADIPKLLAKLDEGFDVASGWRKKRKDKWLTRKLPSKCANWIISRMTGVYLHDYGCSLKAYRAEYIDSIQLYGEMHRFIPAYVGMVGAKVVEVPVNHRARTRGESKYGLMRTFKVVIDLITVKFLSSFATKPSYLFGGVGATLCFLGILSAGEVIIEKFAAGTFAHKNPFLLLAVFLFFLGVQLVLMGLIAEVQARIYHESQDKSIYLVKKKTNFSAND